MSARTISEEARLSDELQATQRYTRSVLEASPDAIVVVGSDGAIVDVNQQMITLCARKRDDLIGARWGECFANPALADASIRQVFTGGALCDFELTMVLRNGQLAVVSCNASQLPGNATTGDRVVVVARDITEQTRTVQALASLVQSSHDAIVGKNVDGFITSWNLGAERLYGYLSPEILGRPFDLLIPEGGRSAEAATMRRVATGERVDPYETERLRKDGTLVTVSVATSPIMGAGGDMIGTASMSQDLRLAEARFRWMLEAAPDAILGIDAAGSIEVVNAQCEHMFGYGRDELIGRPVEVLIPDGVYPAKAGQISTGLALVAVARDGTEIPVEINLSTLKTGGGQLTMAAIRDVTARRDFERQLQEQNVELERASRAKDNFLSSMSHELRTPLNAIIGFTGTMLMKLPGPLNADQEHQLRLVQSSGKHLLSIINDLLDLAKIESGRVQIALERVDCRQVAEEVVQSLQPLAERKGMMMTIEAPDTPVFATADQRALGQILINLINNGLKFGDTGTVRVGLTPSDGSQSPVEITVSDTGPGIPEADLERIFHAFERSVATAKASEEGTGLGLHISQRLAELLGATLTVSSVVGEGATFTVSLPAEGTAALPADGNAALPADGTPALPAEGNATLPAEGNAAFRPGEAFSASLPAQ